MTPTTTRRLMLSLAAITCVTLAGCPMPDDMTNGDDTPPANTNTNGSDDGMTGDNDNSNPPANDNMSGDNPANDNANGTGDNTNGNNANDGDSENNNGDDIPSDMNDNENMNGGLVGGGGGGGTPDLPDPMLDDDSPACTLALLGIGTNPGDGPNREFVAATIILDEPDGSVIIRPVLPPPFDGNQLTVTSTTNAVVNFVCSDTISLGGVTFIDAFGNAVTPGEVAFDRGTDVICGQPVTITFNTPCTVTLSSP